VSVPTVAEQNSAVSEFQLKVAFIWKFLQFSEWKVQKSPDSILYDNEVPPINPSPPSVGGEPGERPIGDLGDAGDEKGADDPQSTWRICFTNSNARSDGFRLLKDRRHQDRAVEIVAVSPEESLSACHILFISSEDAPNYNVEKIPRSVLTIGEDDQFFVRGGLVQFVIKNRRLRFKINREKIRQSLIRIDARVLRLAINMGEGI
jgi:hypothetical protein